MRISFFGSSKNVLIKITCIWTSLDVVPCVAIVSSVFTWFYSNDDEGSYYVTIYLFFALKHLSLN